MSSTVAIDELQVGMFIHLDLGWWAHPFALSSFLISSPDQIGTIRGLGLQQLRWSPEKSRLAQASGQAEYDDPAAAAGEDPAPAQTDTDTDADVDKAATASPGAASGKAVPATAAAPAAPADAAGLAAQAGTATATTTAAGAAAAARIHLPAAAGRQLSAAAQTALAERRAQLARQHLARQLCERQYGEAGVALVEAQRQLPVAPEQAREITEGLTRALLDKMMVDQEMCVRVLGDVGGDRACGHALNVAVIAMLMGRVFGFSADDMLDLGVGALLHDIGKLELPERVRHGDARLSSAELDSYREHVALGVAQGRRMGLRDGALAVLAQHHEMADASGFPARLNLDRMAVGARIVALVNRYDKLCNPAQLALALTPHEALSLIFAQCRTQFDSTMLNAFIRMMGVYPPGSLVQLTDDRFATVVSCNSSRPLKPRVLVCDTQVPVDEALLINLDGVADLGIRRSLKATQLPAAARDYLSPRQRMVYFFEPVHADAAAAAEPLAA